MDENVICDVCGKDRKNLCDTNWKRHLKSCKEKKLNKEIKELEKRKIYNERKQKNKFSMQGFSTMDRFLKKARLDVECHKEIPSTSHNEERVYAAAALIDESDCQPNEDIEIPLTSHSEERVLEAAALISESDCQPNENIEVVENLPVQIEANKPAK